MGEEMDTRGGINTFSNKKSEETGYDTDIKILPFYSSSDSNYSFNQRPKLANRFN